MNPFKKARWIWKKDVSQFDDYVSFATDFTSGNEQIKLWISCDSIYAVYLNDQLIKTMQCSDYPFFKYYDEIILKVRKNNHLRIDVWHLGVKSSNYYPSHAGLIFEIYENQNIIAYSNEKTKSRLMNEFENGLNKKITTQLGLTFSYNNTVYQEDYSPSVEVKKNYSFFHLRKINNIDILKLPKIQNLRQKPSILIDLGKETVGFPILKFSSNIKQKLLICFGEHIIDNGVRRIIGDRDFSFEFIAKEGKNEFINPLRRIAGRYLEIFYEEEIDVDYIGLVPVCYHHEIIEKQFDDPLLTKIYNTSIYTLECCMHEHYEDCPWREQSLYSLDSRNQMLCGYYAFKGFEYQRHNLILIAHDPMPLGLLSLTYPEDNRQFSIPMFSLTYVIQCYEYLIHTSDRSILKVVRKPIDKIVSEFQRRIDKTNLIPYFEKPYWNFYEWEKESANEDVFDPNSPIKKDQYDFIINAMYLYAINCYNQMFHKNIDVSKTKSAIQKTFYDEKTHLFKLNTNTKSCSQFSNALALLIGLGDDITVRKVQNCEGMIPASLPVRGFVYDALINNLDDGETYVIHDIKTRYQKMLDDGATTFYEVETGASAFDNAGSLCHGWSALPVYYLSILKEHH